MIDNREEQIRKYFQDLREAHRETILATRGADWQQNMPIMDALARAEREQGAAPTEGDKLSPLGSFEPIDVGIHRPDASPADPPQYTPVAPSSPDIPTPTSPLLSTLPDIESPALVGQQDTMPADPSLSVNPADTLASVRMEAPVSPPPPAGRPQAVVEAEAAVRPPRPNQSREDVASRRKAMRQIAGLPPDATPRDKPAAPNEPAPPVAPGRTLPFLQAPAFAQAPEAMVSDGSNTPHDIAEAGSFSADTTEMTALMLADTLERMVGVMLKLQAQLNNINNVLERSFGS